MGFVATSEIQAAEAGRDVLRDGGTAVDACIAMAAALTVTEPTSNGLGGDLFALVARGTTVTGLAANGPSPHALPAQQIRASGIPLRGWPSVTVPGQVAGWEALHRQGGRLPWPRLLDPAIRLARDGFVVGSVTAAAWARSAAVFGDMPSWCDTFLVDGAPPAAGSRFVAPDHAWTLEQIAHGGAAAFAGPVAERIVAFSEATGGWVQPSDFDGPLARWVEPLSVPFGDWQVVGMTAPTQGVCALQALGLLQDGGDGGLESVHRAIEATKLAFADTTATMADPEHLRVVPEALLEPAYLAERRALLGPTAGPSPAVAGPWGGTVLLVAIDDAGTSASVIQSNFHGFGSGLVVPGTGIALQNRGAGFSTDPAHPNAMGAGKRPFHTILPGLIRTEHGWAPFGCMGGQMQPQGHVQMVTALARGAAPEEAVGARRWRWLDAPIPSVGALAGDVALEVGFDEAVARSLEHRGHRVCRDVPSTQFGGAQLLWPTATGWSGASDWRKDGAVLEA